MKRTALILGLILVYALLVSPHVFAQNATETPLPACQTYHLTGDIGRVRSCAGDDCNVIGGFTSSEAICVLGIAEDDANWRLVQLGTDDTTEQRTTGFMRADLITPGQPGTPSSASSYCDAWEVTTPQVNVRSCAEATCGSIGTLNQGDRVCATGYSGSYKDWQEVEYLPGVTGYVDSSLMDFVNVDDFPCDTYQPISDVTVYSCAGIGCASVGTLAPGDTVCSSGTVSEELDWIRISYGTTGESGYLLTRNLQVVSEEQLLTVTPTIEPTLEARAIARASINVRASNDSTSDVVGILPANTGARIIGVGENGWYLVELDTGVQGWVSPTSVQTVGDLSGVQSAVALSTQAPEAVTGTSVAQAASATASQTTAPTERVATVTSQSQPTSPATDTPASTTAPTETLPAPTETVSAATALAACTYYQVNSDAINVRNAPTTSGEVVATLQRNSAVCVRGEAASQDQNAWYTVDLNPNGSTPTIGYVAQFLVVPFQGATPTLVNSPVPTNTGSAVTADVVETATLPADGTQIVCPTDVPAATVLPGETPAATTQASVPSIVGCITPTPTPLLTAQPTQFASDVILARDIPLTTLGVRQNITLRSPQGIAQFRLRIPDDWEPTGNSVLYLNLEYFEDATGAIGVDFAPPITTLDIRLDDNLIGSVSLNANTIGVQTLQIPLPASILANPVRRSHTVSISLDARDACRVRLESRAFIRVDQSFVHYEYREYLPVLDLARYPRPLFNNRRIVNEFESAWIVMPAQPSEADYQAAASISAGLGLLTSGDLQVRVVTADTLTTADREANHLILVGEVGTNSMIDDLYSRNALPTTLNAEGQLTFRDEAIDSQSGVVQLIQNPENARRAIFVVTGQSDLALTRAGQALGGRPSVLGLGGTLAIISDTQPLFHPVTSTVFEQPVTFADLGVTDDIILSGIGTQITTVEFTMPFGGVLSQDAYVNIDYNYSQILAGGNSTFTVEMNSIPIGSTPLVSLTSGSPTPTQLPSSHTLRIGIPATSVIPGNTNTLTLQLDVPLDYGCEPPNPTASWFTISRNSTLFLPRTSINSQLLLPVVGLFPVPMNSVPNLQDVWLVLPANPTPQEMEQGMQMFSLLGAQTSLGEGFIPHISLGELPTGTDLSQYHFIVIGRPSTNAFLQDLNPNLPQPFLEGSDQI
ncbi:MAG: cellulose biosynthesis cyclic di-GMP-binding regulatory protein BcsB [Anaerolineae bacterium]